MNATSQLLAEQFMPLANKLAYQKKKNLPAYIDIEELKSAAYMGLVEAANRYDENRGVNFSTFSYPRIMGAINDYLRDLGWGSRSNPTRVASLDLPQQDDGQTMANLIEGKNHSDAEELFEDLTVGFDNHAKQVLRSYFIDENSMKEVGRQFGVTESRISQLIKEYKERIKDNLLIAA